METFYSDDYVVLKYNDTCWKFAGREIFIILQTFSMKIQFVHGAKASPPLTPIQTEWHSVLPTPVKGNSLLAVPKVATSC